MLQTANLGGATDNADDHLEMVATAKQGDDTNHNESIAPQNDDVKLLEQKGETVNDGGTAKSAEKKKHTFNEEDLKKFKIPKAVMEELNLLKGRIDVEEAPAEDIPHPEGEEEEEEELEKDDIGQGVSYAKLMSHINLIHPRN